MPDAARISAPVILLSETKREGVVDLGRALPEDGAILQMSSGTTGFKKGIRYPLADIRRHVEDYNKVLELTAADRIVSWLPLYHDMGYIAAFIMPRMLGIDLVLLDPMVWVRKPGLLAEAIDRYEATVCYMPNFGFEVMSGKAGPEASRMPSMRLWISCSEPTRAETMHRFMAATGTPETHIANCWGMAENIFAVAQSVGISARTIDGVEVVSCGRPIPGTQVKSVDGEIYARSAYSLQSYIDAELVLDAEGFYPTGDLGEIVDGEVFLQGRKKDIINNGGRKTLLSDLDFLVGEAYREAAGRIASFAHFDKTLGTEIPVILIEDARFWEKNRDAALNRRILQDTGIELARAYFVPPKFISKTSSGKINRRLTGRNWALTQGEASSGEAAAAGTAINEIRRLFPWLDLDRVIAEQLDSLGFVNLSLVFAKYGLRLADGTRSVNQSLAAHEGAPVQETGVLKIVSLCDANVFRPLSLAPLKAFAEKAGIPVEFSHVCAPPAGILLSDMIFFDQFLVRDSARADYIEFKIAIDLIKSASIVIVDDASLLLWPVQGMIYPKMSHDFQADARADLLGVRWALYSSSLDKLPVQLVDGTQADKHDLQRSLDDLESYLGVPFIRIAYGPPDEFTEGWDIHGRGDTEKVCLFGDSTGLDYPQFSLDLQAALTKAARGAPIRSGGGETFFNFDDQAHWCSWLVNRDLVDFILSKYRSIAVLGKAASVPYLGRRAAELGIHLDHRLDLLVPDDCDCVVQTGSWGKPDTDKPVFQIMAAGWMPEPAINISREMLAALPPSRV